MSNQKTWFLMKMVSSIIVGYLKLTDFGIACNKDPINFKLLVGTPSYMGNYYINSSGGSF
jgi:hypothetical protein